jgi:hypothetical protein
VPAAASSVAAGSGNSPANTGPWQKGMSGWMPAAARPHFPMESFQVYSKSE